MVRLGVRVVGVNSCLARDRLEELVSGGVALRREPFVQQWNSSQER
jgi:hypothetical protein